MTHTATPNESGAPDDNTTIEAVPTWYAGITFRSHLEAKWAATLDTLGVVWTYEPETITLPSGTVYIPDFWLPELRTWLEAKGTGIPRIEKAVELGESRACHCKDQCTCQWPGGQLVLIGHPPKPYNPWTDPRYDNAPPWVPRRHGNHGGHPVWSTAHGRSAWVGCCQSCQRMGWWTETRCRACGTGATGGHAYFPGDRELEFVKAAGLPAENVPSAPEHQAALAALRPRFRTPEAL